MDEGCRVVPQLPHVDDRPSIQTRRQTLTTMQMSCITECLFIFRKRFCSLKFCPLCLTPELLSLFSFCLLSQTPKDPSSREILRCHGHQANPPNSTADLHIHNAVQCLRHTSISTHMYVCALDPVYSTGLYNLIRATSAPDVHTGLTGTDGCVCCFLKEPSVCLQRLADCL